MSQIFLFQSDNNTKQISVQKWCQIDSLDMFLRLIKVFIQMEIIRKILEPIPKINDYNCYMTQQSNQVKNIIPDSISYKYYLVLKRGSYNGIAEIMFSLSDNDLDLHLNFTGKELKKVILNGKSISGDRKGKQLIVLPYQQLLAGKNRVIVEYANKYNNEGYGLTYLMDVDQRQYVYTHFEPEGCRNVFPCFDVPALKATMELSLLTADNWIARSNQTIRFSDSFRSEKYFQYSQSSQEINEILSELINKHEGKMWFFNKTKIITTYGFCFAAGEYFQIVNQHPYNEIPISVLGMHTFYGRIKKNIDLIFETISQSLKFFEQTFKIPYSFSKCDNIFVYEFATGAMENPGLILYSNNFLYSSELSAHGVMALCGVISHQLSHQWFGNLVSIHSWSDIWLNEGFATFVSYYCLNKVKNNLNLTFQADFMLQLIQKKTFSCRFDRSDYTHPVRCCGIQNPIDTFDKITYGKGGYLVKQLLAAMGEDNFWKAVNKYLQIFSWKNANIDQFFQTLSNTNQNTDLDLEKWKQTWLEEQSFNVFECVRDQSSLNVFQKFVRQQKGVYRHHHMKAALFKSDHTYTTIDLVVPYSPVVSLQLPEDNKAVLIDCEDDSFIQQKIDPISRQFFKQNLKNIPNTFMQAIIWKCFYDQIVNGELTAFQYMNIVIDNIPIDNPALLELVLGDLSRVISTFTPSQFTFQLKKGVYSLLKQLMKEQTNQHVKAILKSYLMTFIVFDSLQQIKAWYYETQPSLSEYKLTLSQRWRMIWILLVNSLITQQQFNSELKILREQEPSYMYRLQEKKMKGKFLTDVEAELISYSITSMIDVNKNLKESMLVSLMKSNYYRNNPKDFGTYNILKTGLDKLSEKSWILLLDTFYSPSSKYQDALYQCGAILELVGDRQHLRIAVEEVLINIKDKVKAHGQYNVAQPLEKTN